jgi:hypothetical protein
VRELLDAVRGFLEKDVVPALHGPARFHALVAANVLAIAGRELASEEGDLVAEWRRLGALLDPAATDPPPRLDALRAAYARRTRRSPRASGEAMPTPARTATPCARTFVRR